MVREHEAGIAQLAHGREEGDESCRDRRGPAGRRRSGRRPARGTTRRCGRARRRGRRARSTVGPASSASCGVSVRRTSPTGAQAVTTSDSGATTCRSRPSTRQAGAHRERILADRDRDAERRAQRLAECAHGVVEVGVLGGIAAGGHPVRRELHVAERADVRGGDVGERLAHRHAARGRRVEQRDRGPFAERHRLARAAGKARGSDRDVADTGTCQGPTSGSRLIIPPTLRSPIVTRKPLSAIAGRRSSRSSASRGIERLGIEAVAAARPADCVALHARRPAEQVGDRHVDDASRPPFRRSTTSRPSSAASPITANGQRSRRQNATKASSEPASSAST